jgi:hypothetical protein
MNDQISNLEGVPPVNKGLLRVVYIMGIILVLLFFALVAGIIYKSRNRVVAADLPNVVDLGLPAGTLAKEAVLSGDKLTINTGSEVIIVEMSSRKVLLRVKVASP